MLWCLNSATYEQLDLQGFWRKIKWVKKRVTIKRKE